MWTISFKELAGLRIYWNININNNNNIGESLKNLHVEHGLIEAQSLQGYAKVSDKHTQKTGVLSQNVSFISTTGTAVKESHGRQMLHYDEITVSDKFPI